MESAIDAQQFESEHMASASDINAPLPFVYFLIRYNVSLPSIVQILVVVAWFVGLYIAKMILLENMPRLPFDHLCANYSFGYWDAAL